MNEFKIIDILGKVSSGNGINLADSLSGIAIYEKKIALLFFSKESGYGDIKKYENLITESVNKEFANTTMRDLLSGKIKMKDIISIYQPSTPQLDLFVYHSSVPEWQWFMNRTETLNDSTPSIYIHTCMCTYIICGHIYMSYMSCT